MENRPRTDSVGRFSIFNCPFSIAAEPPVPRWIAGLTPWLIGLIGGVLAAGLFLLPLVFDRLRPAARGVLDGVAPPTGLSWGLAGLLLAGIGAALLARGRWRPALLTATMCGLVLAAAGLVAPTAHGILQGALREFSKEAGSLLEPGDPVVVYGLNAPSIVFYADRRVKPVGADAPGEVEAAVRGLVHAGRPAVVIARSNLVPRLNQMEGLTLRASRGGYALFVAPR